MKHTTVGLLLLAASQAANAQQLPSAGGQLRQLPPPPVQQPSAPAFRVDRPVTAPPAADAGPGFPVSTLRITGDVHP